MEIALLYFYTALHSSTQNIVIVGPSRDFSGRGICHFLRRDIGKLGFEITGNVIRYTHGTGNVLIFLLGKREKYERTS